MPEPYTMRSTRLSLLGGAEESTAGSLPTITTPLANTTVYEASLEPGDFFANGHRAPIGTYDGEVPAVPGAQSGTLTFKIEVANGDQFLPLLTGCGFQLSSSLYKPLANLGTRKTWGFKLWENGRYKTLAGAAGNCVIEIARGAPVMATFTFTGIWGAPGDGSLPTQTPITAFPLRGLGGEFAIGGAAVPYAERLTVDLRNTVSLRPNIIASSGIAHAYVQRGAPTISFDPEARLVAENGAFAALLAGTTAAFKFKATDGSNNLWIAAPSWQRLRITAGDRDGIRTDPVEGQCNMSAGQDDIVFGTSEPSFPL